MTKSKSKCVREISGEMMERVKGYERNARNAKLGVQ